MNVHAFTIEAGEILENVISRVSVRQSAEFCAERIGLGSEQADIFALWDTGANRSCVSARLAKRLGLANSDVYDVVGVNGVHSAKVYRLDILLPNMVSVRDVYATEFIDNGDFDVIRGMDIITCGDFAISNYGRKTLVSFRIPSQNPPIDFRGS
jgi:hypothetical protein